MQKKKCFSYQINVNNSSSSSVTSNLSLSTIYYINNDIKYAPVVFACLFEREFAVTINSDTNIIRSIHLF